MIIKIVVAALTKSSSENVDYFSDESVVLFVRLATIFGLDILWHQLWENLCIYLI